MYFDPAVDQAKADGLGTLGQFIYYDAMVMHGPGDDPVSFGGIRRTAMKGPDPRPGRQRDHLPERVPRRPQAAMLTEAAHDDTAASTPSSGCSSGRATSTSTRRCAGRRTATPTRSPAEAFRSTR